MNVHSTAIRGTGASKQTVVVVMMLIIIVKIVYKDIAHLLVRSP
jgi:hypothetical protein